MKARIVILLLLSSTLAYSQNCWQASKDQLGTDTSTFLQAVRHTPRAMVEGHNLKWELPVAAATALFVAYGDTHVANEVKGAQTLNSRSDTASTAMTDLMVGAAGVTFLAGCATSHDHALRSGFNALAAAGFALASDEALKLAFNRQRPAREGGQGDLWDGGKSFPSGHTTAAWAVASALAHSYPRNRWIKWSAYAAATSIGILRITSHQHFPSDVIVGGTLGYTIGERLSW